MRNPARRTLLAALLLLPLLCGCKENTAALEARVAVLEAQVAALQTQQIAFSQIQGTLDDAQVPDDITVAFAQSAGDADTLDGFHANEIAESGSFTPTIQAPPIWVPVGTFSYLRTGTRVRVTGTITIALFDLHQFFPLAIDLGSLPYRSSAFGATTDAIGVCVADLTEHGAPASVTCSLGALVASAQVRLSLQCPSIPGDGTVSVDFSYDVDP